MCQGDVGDGGWGEDEVWVGLAGVSRGPHAGFCICMSCYWHTHINTPHLLKGGHAMARVLANSLALLLDHVLVRAQTEEVALEHGNGHDADRGDIDGRLCMVSGLLFCALFYFDRGGARIRGMFHMARWR